MTAPNPAPEDALTALSEASGDPEAFRLVYSVLMQRYDDSIRVGHMTKFADEVAAIAVQTLRDAGRLLPPDADPASPPLVAPTHPEEPVTQHDPTERTSTMHAEITVTGPGRGTLHLDGQDFSKDVQGFTLNASVGEVTRLEVDLMIFEDTKVSGEVEVYIPPVTVALLERLGWTPPAP